MPERWAVERAVKASDLCPSARLIMLTLLTNADTRTAVLPYDYCPSLTALAKDTGLHKATVKRQLLALERADWLLRCRPSIHAARTKHARTGYHCQLPGLGAPGAAEGCKAHPELGAPCAQARRTMRPELGASRAQGLGAPCAPNQNRIQNFNQGEALTALVIETVREHTGKTISGQDATRGIHTKLDGRTLRDPAAYLVKVIATDPKWWLPTPMPPRLDELDELGRPRHRQEQRT